MAPLFLHLAEFARGRYLCLGIFCLCEEYAIAVTRLATGGFSTAHTQLFSLTQLSSISWSITPRCSVHRRRVCLGLLPCLPPTRHLLVCATFPSCAAIRGSFWIRHLRVPLVDHSNHCREIFVNVQAADRSTTPGVLPEYLDVDTRTIAEMCEDHTRRGNSERGSNGLSQRVCLSNSASRFRRLFPQSTAVASVTLTTTSSIPHIVPHILFHRRYLY